MSHWSQASFAVAAIAATIAAPVAAQTVAIENAHIYSMGPAGEIENGSVLIRDGKIIAVGSKINIPPNSRIIDANGRIVTPGLILGSSSVGIRDLPGYTAVDDTSTRSSLVSAGYDLRYVLNGESPVIADARAEGVTGAIVTPDVLGRSDTPMFFGGQAAFIRMSDDPVLLVRNNIGVTMVAGGPGALVAGGGRGAQFVLLKAVLSEARRFASNPRAFDEARMRDLGLSRIDLAALAPVAAGNVPLIVEASRVADIRALIDFAREEKIRLVLSGAQEAWIVAKALAAARIPVILGPEDNFPDGLDSMGTTEANAARLHAAGVTIAFKAVHSRPWDLVRSPRTDVGRLVGRTDLSFMAALEALTTAPARIAGVSDQVGSIAPGMKANLVIWSGDPLEAQSFPDMVFIDGASQSLVTRQQLLGRRYLQRYRDEGVIR